HRCRARAGAAGARRAIPRARIQPRPHRHPGAGAARQREPRGGGAAARRRGAAAAAARDRHRGRIAHAAVAGQPPAPRARRGPRVDLAAWTAAGRRLYETGAFQSVDIQRTVLDNTPAAPDEEPVRATVTVQEWPPVRVRYGVEVRDELNAAGDAARSNSPETESPGGGPFWLRPPGPPPAPGPFWGAVSPRGGGPRPPGTRRAAGVTTAAA